MSGLINLLTLTGSFFMLEIYDRVIPSRSIPTLVGLCVLALILFTAQASLEALRSRILARIGDKWSVLVVMSLADDTFRFNELKRLVDGISQRMLTLTLRGLERDGLVERTFYPTIPPKVSYALTELCRSLQEPVGALGQWAIEHRGTVERSRQLYDRRSGEEDAVPHSGPR